MPAPKPTSKVLEVSGLLLEDMIHGPVGHPVSVNRFAFAKRIGASDPTVFRAIRHMRDSGLEVEVSDQGAGEFALAAQSHVNANRLLELLPREWKGTPELRGLAFQYVLEVVRLKPVECLTCDGYERVFERAWPNGRRCPDCG